MPAPVNNAKPKKKSVSPHNGNQAHIIDNYMANANLFIGNIGGPSNSGVPTTKQRNLVNAQRINHVAQQQYATNVVTTQSRKGPHERYIAEKQSTGQREPTPVFVPENVPKGSSKENSYAIGKPGMTSQADLANQRQTLSAMYHQMKEQKDNGVGKHHDWA